MEAINTKLFTLNELKYKSFSKLYEFLNGLEEVALELEANIFFIENLEKENGFLDKNMNDTLNDLITQLDYVIANIKTGVEAMTFCEKESFMEMSGFHKLTLN
jgi:hypothetical protein